MMITTGATLFAQNASVNPYGLVYQGAITKNEEGRVHIHPVSYKNKHGIDISANLYTPAGYDGNKRYLLGQYADGTRLSHGQLKPGYRCLFLAL